MKNFPKYEPLAQLNIITKIVQFYTIFQIKRSFANFINYKFKRSQYNISNFSK